MQNKKRKKTNKHNQKPVEQLGELGKQSKMANRKPTSPPRESGSAYHAESERARVLTSNREGKRIVMMALARVRLLNCFRFYIYKQNVQTDIFMARI